jgi:hypothetical protein
MNILTQSWQDLPVAPPIDPRAIILNTQLGIIEGTFVRSTSLLQSAYAASPLVYTGNNTKVMSLDITDSATIVDCQQWTFNHQMTNASANIPPALSKVAYTRAGKNYDNQIEINFGASTYNNVQLTMRDNQGTSGTFLNGSVGSIPAFSFGNGITGNQILHLTIPQTGVYSMVLVMLLSGNWSVFEMELVVMP